MNKQCFKCSKHKPITEFYKHPGMADGRLNKCKECNKHDVKENYAKKLEHYTAYEKQPERRVKAYARHRAYAKTPAGKEAHQRGTERFSSRHPLKRNAHIITGNAIRDGILIKQACEKCGSVVKIEAHHDDYNKPLKVRWLCESHHKQFHFERGDFVGAPRKYARG